IASPCVALAQGTGANIGGVVTDDTGGALPGVTVTITNKANGAVQTTVTGAAGNYRAVALQPAPYEMKAELSGFNMVKKDDTLTIGAALWGSPTINMTQDAVQEFKVMRNQFDAQYGSALSAVMNVVTKSGTNLYSGSGFFFGRNKHFNARNVFATGANPPYSQARDGGSFGGPIRQNKTH